MAVSKAQIKAVSKYEQKTYDKVLLRMPKGSRTNIITKASVSGESLNGYICRLIYEDLDRGNNSPD